MAIAEPVLPLVAATTVPPGRSLPSASAHEMMWFAMRSLMEPLGLKNSALPKILTPGLALRNDRSTRGVSPMSSRVRRSPPTLFRRTAVFIALANVAVSYSKSTRLGAETLAGFGPRGLDGRRELGLRLRSDLDASGPDLEAAAGWCARRVVALRPRGATAMAGGGRNLCRPLRPQNSRGRAVIVVEMAQGCAEGGIAEV
mmetsp:Transcript_20420/g.53411  ORF Transcript_20420/g.53411 Transcript_20420/m.53411 type:complete len:200 (-) Transcript_20420:110-709(-)